MHERAGGTSAHGAVGADAIAGRVAPLVPLRATPEVAATLHAIGRTEDLAFSPDGRRIAIAGFARDAITLVDCTIRPGPPTAVELTGATSVQCAGLAAPHGVAFLDDRTLLVANRDGGLIALHLAGHAGPAHQVRTEVVETVGLDGWHSPGSVAVGRVVDGEGEVLVCDNFAHAVTRDVVARDGARLVGRQRSVLRRRWLDIPDGLALDRAGRWVAISNHTPHVVVIYERETDPAEDADPVGLLRGCAYPHGLAFTEDGQHLLVADAGTPHVHLYTAAGSWGGVRYPSASVRVMDDATFARGRHNQQEGGPKGLAVAPDGSVAAITSDHLPLAFLDLPALVATATEGPTPPHVAQELAVLAEHATLRRRALAAEQDLDVAREALASTAERAEVAEARLADALAAAVAATARADRAEAARRPIRLARPSRLVRRAGRAAVALATLRRRR